MLVLNPCHLYSDPFVPRASSLEDGKVRDGKKAREGMVP